MKNCQFSFRPWPVILIVSSLILLLFFFAYSKQGMIATVKLREAALTSFAESLLCSNEESIREHFGYNVVAYPQTSSVFFEHHKGDYDGVFYTSSGVPVGFQGTVASFTRDGDTWIWKEANGDNWMYVEHIVGNWFWYEMHF